MNGILGYKSSAFDSHRLHCNRPPLNRLKSDGLNLNLIKILIPHNLIDTPPCSDEWVVFNGLEEVVFLGDWTSGPIQNTHY